jgi:hypothetical protein
MLPWSYFREAEMCESLARLVRRWIEIRVVRWLQLAISLSSNYRMESAVSSA